MYEDWTDELVRSFEANRNAENAEGAYNYMRKQFVFLGLKADLRRSLAKPFLREAKSWSMTETLLKVEELWLREEREYQHFAMELLAASKKKWDFGVWENIETCVLRKSWWDTVDYLASNCAGPFFRAFPDLIEEIVLNRWNGSNNLWLNRTAILYQLKYKDDTDLDVLEKCILKHASSTEFFHRKAIGWALRQYAKFDAEWVRNFVKHNELSGLSKREALKNIGFA